MPLQVKSARNTLQCLSAVAILALSALAGCSALSTKAASFAGTDSGSRRTAPAQPGAGIDPEKALPNPDEGIARSLDAAFLENRLHVRYVISGRIVTLTGNVSSQSKRTRAGRVAAAVVNVHEAVNERRVKPRKSRFSN